MHFFDEAVTTVAQAGEDGYDIVLRRRRHGDATVDELIVNGAFAMDSASTVSECALAESLGENPGRVLVGGLGLGFTARRLLDHGATHLDIVEISQALIDWARSGLIEPAAGVAADPRVTLHRGDVADLLRHQPTLPGLFGPWDAICLDIDNGPDFLIHPGNHRLYSRDGMAMALSHLPPGGRLALWSQGPSKDFWFDLVSLDPGATERLVAVDRGNRRIDYAIYTLTRLD
jgi:spermidine synthase